MARKTTVRTKTSDISIEVKRVIHNLTQRMTSQETAEVIAPLANVSKNQVAAIKAHFTMGTYA